MATIKIELIDRGFERVQIQGMIAGVIQREGGRWVFVPSSTCPGLTAQALQQLASYLAAKGQL